MSLLDIAERVHADDALKVFPSPIQGNVSVKYAVGAWHEDPGAPYVEWHPTTDKFEPFRSMQGPVPPTFNGGTHVLATRLVGGDLYIHGEHSPGTDDYASTETLLNAVIFALMRSAGTNLTIESGRWLDGTEQESGADRKVYVLSITFAVPVTEPKASYSTVNFTLPSHLPVKAGVTYLDGDTVGPSTPPP